ncbi:MAG TPA: phosphoribosyl-AMP cyclohydrolase [Candidatus Methanoperedens sp.]|nr:phosphoribosyl-AMP cyclohydrolase [Candidatus Methanoperedens sp.]
MAAGERSTFPAGALPDLKFDANGLITAVVQDATTHEVLMVAWMNRESLQLTLQTGYTVFWSRSRQKLWKKGETSGCLQRVREVRADCDADTLLVLVDQTGPACHTGSRSCFFQPLPPAAAE